MQNADAYGNGLWHRLTVFAGATTLLILPIVLIYLALTFAPIGPTHSPVAPDVSVVRLLGGLFWVSGSEEARMLVVVMLVAAIGSIAAAPVEWRPSPWARARSQPVRTFEPKSPDTKEPAETTRRRPSVFVRLGGYLAVTLHGALLGAFLYL